MESIFAKALDQENSNTTAQEKRELLSRLLARLAHEIRNPLSSLHIHVQLLEEDVSRSLPDLKGKFAGRFEILHGELNRLEGVVKQFVSLSGPATLNLQSVAPAKIVENVAALLHPEADTRGVSLTIDCAADLQIRADPGQLTQALVNLVINAIQAVERGGSVVMSAKSEGNRVLIEVRDTGPGVDSAEQSAIFEPFYTTKTEGSGLGLWIVQQIVSAHQGAVRVKNGEPHGAVFAIELPVNPA